MDNFGWTEAGMRQFIEASIPGINYKDMFKIRNRFVYDFIPLDIAVAEYALNQKIKQWNKSKDKHYYRIRKHNKTIKYTYMCKEHIEHVCAQNGYTYEKVG